MSEHDGLLAPNGDIVKYTQWSVGDKIQGTLVATPRVLPDTDFTTKEQKKSKAGNPLWKFKLTLETADGVKTLFPSGAAYWAALNAFKKAGIRSFELAEGGTFALKRDEDTPSKTPGFAPAKNYQAAFKPAAS